MFTRRVLFFGVAAFALFAVAVTAGKKPPPPSQPDPAILYIDQDPNGEWSQWVMDANGANRTKIYGGTGVDVWSCGWSPDNTQIVLLLELHTLPPTDWGFFIFDADGTHERRIFASRDGHPGGPVWFRLPSGEERIAHVWLTEDHDLWSMKTDGTAACPMMVTPDRIENGFSISQDGTVIAISYSQDGRNRVVLGTLAVDSAGCPVVVSEIPLTDVPGSPLEGQYVGAPFIDPTGTKVAVEAKPSTSPISGRWIIPISSPASAWKVPVVWGPPDSCSWLDERTIVYEKYGNRGSAIFKCDIYLGQEVMLADGKSHRLTSPQARH